MLETPLIFVSKRRIQKKKGIVKKAIQKKAVMSVTQMSDSEEKERSPQRILEQRGHQENTTASIILSKMSLWYPERKLMMAQKEIMFICLENGAGSISHLGSWNRENDDRKLVKFQAIFIVNQRTSIRIMSLL